jgi:hypothetical protein
MAAYFKLISKETGEPVAFATIDTQLCEALNVPCHPKDWYLDWYNMIGLMLATGHSWDEIHGEFRDYPAMLDVIQWLEDHYISSAWSAR